MKLRKQRAFLIGKKEKSLMYNKLSYNTYPIW